MSERVQHLQFNRNGIVRLAGVAIGRVDEAKRCGPRGGEFRVYDWRPNTACPPHLLGPIHSSTRMRQIHGELRTLHYQPKSKIRAQSLSVSRGDA